MFSKKEYPEDLVPYPAKDDIQGMSENYIECAEDAKENGKHEEAEEWRTDSRKLARVSQRITNETSLTADDEHVVLSLLDTHEFFGAAQLTEDIIVGFIKTRKELVFPSDDFNLALKTLRDTAILCSEALVEEDQFLLVPALVRAIDISVKELAFYPANARDIAEELDDAIGSASFAARSHIDLMHMSRSLINALENATEATIEKPNIDLIFTVLGVNPDEFKEQENATKKEADDKNSERVELAKEIEEDLARTSKIEKAIKRLISKRIPDAEEETDSASNTKTSETPAKNYLYEQVQMYIEDAKSAAEDKCLLVAEENRKDAIKLARVVIRVAEGINLREADHRTTISWLLDTNEQLAPSKRTADILVDYINTRKEIELLSPDFILALKNVKDITLLLIAECGERDSKQEEAKRLKRFASYLDEVAKELTFYPKNSTAIAREFRKEIAQVRRKNEPNLYSISEHVISALEKHQEDEDEALTLELILTITGCDEKELDKKKIQEEMELRDKKRKEEEKRQQEALEASRRQDQLRLEQEDILSL